MIYNLNFSKTFKKHSHSFLYRLTRSIWMALTVFCTILLFIYIMGNYQNFQEESQLLILRTIRNVAVVNIIISLPVVLEAIYRLITRENKIKRSILLVLLILMNIYNCFCMFFSNLIVYISKGF